MLKPWVWDITLLLGYVSLRRKNNAIIKNKPTGVNMSKYYLLSSGKLDSYSLI